jgi:hypothetical protein
MEDMMPSEYDEMIEAQRLKAESEALEAFVTEADKVGIPRNQAEFLYKYFALKDHCHWDGRIG